MSKTKWAEIPEYEGFFVSDNGLVQSKHGKMLTQRPNAKGYLRVDLSKNATTKGHAVAKLVLISFGFPKPSAIHQAAHWNGVKTDNRLTNLRWATPQENEADKKRHGTVLVGEKNKKAKITEKDAVYIKENYVRKSYRCSNANDLAGKFGVSKQQIMKIVKGDHWNGK